MKILISGGAKNGKSTFAEDAAISLAKKECCQSQSAPKLFYVATMIPHDDEDNLRIERHIKERDGKGFETIECGNNISSLIGRVDPDGTYLIDSTTALLSNVMFKTDDGKNFEFDDSAAIRVAGDLIKFSDSVKNVIFVSDYIAADIIYEELTEKYREGLAHLDKRLALACDKVYEICLGNAISYK